jgi:hypothetical protein
MGTPEPVEDEAMRVRCKSGIKGYQEPLRKGYDSFEEFREYSDIYGLAKRLGFPSAKAAWDENPVIQGSVIPEDYRIAPGWVAKNRKPVLFLWLPLGDRCEYEEFGEDFSPVADVLFENSVRKFDVYHWFGIEAAGFRGENYISLYWGDKDAQFEKGLTKADFAELRRELKKAEERCHGKRP